MLTKVFRILIFSTFCLTSILTAQSSNRYGDSDWDDWDDEMLDWYGDSRPMIELNYGLGKLEHDNFGEGRFGDIGSFELKLGYSEIDTHYEDYLLELDSRYIFAGKIDNKIRSDNELQDHQYISESFRIGIGNRQGYGYKFGPAALIPYNQSALLWNKFNKLERNKPVPPGFIDLTDPQEVVDRYGDSFRFSSLSEAGAKFEIANMFAFNVSYEGTVIYPRVKVWKWLGSYVIEQSGYAALGEFVEEIMDRVPAAGPIMNVLLRGGYQYAFYLLKKEKMNWPFETEAPLSYEQFKFGITLTF
jgi:hypothetical protein